MENKQSPPKKLISIQKDKLIREVDSAILAGSPRLSRKQLHLDLEILQKSSRRQAPKRVLVSIKSRPPVIKTIYIAEKSRFFAKKSSDKSGARLAIGDHSSSTSHFACISEKGNENCYSGNLSSVTDQEETSLYVSKCSVSDIKADKKVYNTIQRPAEKCYVYTQPQLNMNVAKIDAKTDKSNTLSSKADIGTFIGSNNTYSENTSSGSNNILNKLHKRIDYLERKILRQEMVFRSIDPNLPLSSSDEEPKDMMGTVSGTGRADCSYIEQYSHIPKTSAFQKYAQQTAPLSPSKAATLEKEHNSEQYGRDFTTYDGITARGRRQCASVPCKRDDVPKTAAERVHKIRHKLNPVRDYRLMDTVHYLAQGEFAPRDDGIKLTPSREAVLSDIIWEDVCRTHWPNTRLGRRVPHADRCSTRCELQRLIDSLLRERVAHVERRRRRHYRIVKLNHRHESCRPVGKTGDIIVASHKNKQTNEERDVVISDHNTAASTMTMDRRWKDQMPRRSHRSHDRLNFPDTSKRNENRHEECIPGPSYAFPRSHTNREATCCYHTASPSKPERAPVSILNTELRRNNNNDITSGSSISFCRPNKQQPRLIVKKDNSRRKYQSKEEPDLEHYILLPTLVVRTPSNVKRQKKFNELYHRILNVQLNNVQKESEKSEVQSTEASESPKKSPSKKDFGFNINITLSDSSVH